MFSSLLLQLNRLYLINYKIPGLLKTSTLYRCNSLTGEKKPGKTQWFGEASPNGHIFGVVILGGGGILTGLSGKSLCHRKHVLQVNCRMLDAGPFLPCFLPSLQSVLSHAFVIPCHCCPAPHQRAKPIVSPNLRLTGPKQRFFSL